MYLFDKYMNTASVAKSIYVENNFQWLLLGACVKDGIR